MVPTVLDKAETWGMPLQEQTSLVFLDIKSLRSVYRVTRFEELKRRVRVRKKLSDRVQGNIFAKKDMRSA